MALRRRLLPPTEATTEGSRRLRHLLRRLTFAAVARRFRCDEGSVRRWAREEGKPSLQYRATGAVVFAIPEAAWDEPPLIDVYATEAPPTARRA